MLPARQVVPGQQQVVGDRGGPEDAVAVPVALRRQVDHPRVVASGNHSIPWELVRLLDENVEASGIKLDDATVRRMAIAHQTLAC